MIYSAEMPKQNLRFLLFTIHGHLAAGNPNYAELFTVLTKQLPGYSYVEGKKRIAVGAARLTGERLLVTIYAGDTDKSVLFFDLAEKAEFTTPNTPQRFQARKTHIIIDPRERLALIEAGRGRVSPEEIAEIIEKAAQKTDDYKTLEISLSPVAAKQFVQKIQSFQRIQLASVSIVRPNPDWTDNYDALSQYAGESGGAAIDATVRAKRGQGLSKDKGLVADIKKWVSDKLAAVSSAHIKGDFGSGLTILNLRDYVETVTIPVETRSDTGLPLESVVENKLTEYLNSREDGGA